MYKLFLKQVLNFDGYNYCKTNIVATFTPNNHHMVSVNCITCGYKAKYKNKINNFMQKLKG